MDSPAARYLRARSRTVGGAEVQILAGSTPTAESMRWPGSRDGLGSACTAAPFRPSVPLACTRSAEQDQDRGPFLLQHVQATAECGGVESC